jgi:hypothetical protein
MGTRDVPLERTDDAPSELVQLAIDRMLMTTTGSCSYLEALSSVTENEVRALLQEVVDGSVEESVA